MKSGLGDRNNEEDSLATVVDRLVSMKSGLGDRNNMATTTAAPLAMSRSQ